MSTTATTAAATTANNEPQQVQTFATGAKRGTDHADCDLALIPPEAIRAYGRAFAEGRKKYGTHNWLKGFPQLGVINHALQHIYSYLEGDRSEDHLGHAMWNIGTAIHQEKHRPDLLDLPPYAEVDRRIHGLAEESLTPAEWNSETEVDLSYTNDTSDSTDTFDLITYLKRQIAFSFLTFGPGDRHKGVIDHIRKELVEIENDPTDLEEWIDVVILALDGAWRSGAHPPQITEKLIAKLEKNEKRNWPDWREVGQDKAIEHDRSKDSNHEKTPVSRNRPSDAVLDAQ